MEQLKSLKIKNYKHIKEHFVGFESIDNFNILIGQNNIGKSTILKAIELLLYEKKMQDITENTVLEFTFCPDDNDIRPIFRTNVFNGFTGVTDYNIGKKLIGKYLSYTYQPLPPFGQSQYILSNINDEPTEKLECKTELLEDLGERFIKQKVRKQKIVKLAADRNLIPELQHNQKSVNEDGTGATNLLRQYLNVASLPNEVVEKNILDALNQIMRPETQFDRIMCQEVSQIDRGESEWEILLVNENGKIPLSSSGSGLRTVILVLIKLFLETRENGFSDFEELVRNSIFIFEELENNLHPAIQRNLFDFLYKWSIQYKTHIFLTTHSTVPINMFSGKPHVTLTHIKKEENEIVTNSALSYIENEDILMNLGVRASDILQSNAVIWVEGPSDRVYINRWIELYSNGKLRENVHYQILFYGGRLLSHLTGRVDNSSELIQLFKANLHSIIVIDSDKTAPNKRINKTKQRIKKEFKNNNAIVWITKGKEIENYLSKKIFYKRYNINKQIGQYDKIEEFLNLNCKKNQGTHYSRNKVSESIENSKIMVKEDLKVLDLEFQIKKITDQINIWNGLY